MGSEGKDKDSCGCKAATAAVSASVDVVSWVRRRGDELTSASLDTERQVREVEALLQRQNGALLLIKELLAFVDKAGANAKDSGESGSAASAVVAESATTEAKADNSKKETADAMPDPAGSVS